MYFSRVELSDDDRAFLDEVRTFLATHITDEVRRCDRETGDNFDEAVHLAAGRRLPRGRVEVRIRRRVQPGAPAHLGAGEMPGRACRGFTVRRS